MRWPTAGSVRLGVARGAEDDLLGVARMGRRHRLQQVDGVEGLGVREVEVVRVLTSRPTAPSEMDPTRTHEPQAGRRGGDDGHTTRPGCALGRSPRERSTPPRVGVAGMRQSYRHLRTPLEISRRRRRWTRALNTGRARRSAEVAERATRRPASTGCCSGIAKNCRWLQGEQGQRRQRHDGDGRAQLVEQRVLGPRVASAQQPDGRAVALDDGVAADDDVPEAHRHVLGLDHLSGVGRADVAQRGDLVELARGQPGEELRWRAERADRIVVGHRLRRGRAVRRCQWSHHGRAS